MKKIIGVLFLIICFSCTNDNELSKIENSYNASKVWMINNINTKGIFNYKYTPETDSYSSGNNMIRQLMMSRILGNLSKTDNELKVVHKKNLDFIFKNWYREDGDIGYVYYSNKSKLGANAMLLRVLIYSPYFKEYEKQAYKLAQGIESLQIENGGFKAWYIEPDYSFDEDYLLTFYSGEALLSIIEFYKKTGEEKYLDIAKEGADFYIREYVYEIDKNYYPAYVPWHTLFLNKLYKIEKNRKYSEAVFSLNDKLLEIQNKFPDSIYYGRFYNPDTPQFGSPHSSSDGVYTEGLLYAYEIAKMEDDDYHEKLYKESIKIGFNNLLNLQYLDKENIKLYGAIRYTEEKKGIRVDTTSHYMDASQKYIELFTKK